LDKRKGMEVVVVSKGNEPNRERKIVIGVFGLVNTTCTEEEKRKDGHMEAEKGTIELPASLKLVGNRSGMDLKPKHVDPPEHTSKADQQAARRT
jgi:hypothetical protein